MVAANMIHLQCQPKNRRKVQMNNILGSTISVHVLMAAFTTRLQIFTFVKIQRNVLHVCPLLANSQDCNISEDMSYIVNDAARTLTASVT